MPIGPSVGIIRNKKPKIDITSLSIKKIVVSPCNVFYLLNDGTLYGWGSNNKLQFGSGIVPNTVVQKLYFWNTAKGAFEETGFSPRTDTGYIVNYPQVGVGYIDNAKQGITSSPNTFTTTPMGYIGSIGSYFSNNQYGDRAAALGDRIYKFSGLLTDEYTSSNFLKTLRVKVFDNFKLKDIDLVQLDDIYGSSVLGIDDNDNLYVWGQSDNLVFGKFTDTNNYTFMDSKGRIPSNKYYDLRNNFLYTLSYSESLKDFKLENIIDKPKKISDEKWNSVVANNVVLGYKHILLKQDGTLHILGGDNNDITQLGSNSNWKYIGYDYGINNNNELYRLSYPYNYDEVTPNLFMGIGTKLGDGNSTTTNPLTTLNFPEKVKTVYGSLSTDDVLFLSETGRLSGIGANTSGVLGNTSQNQFKLYEIPRNDKTSIQDVILTNYNSVFCKTTDNSLITWGDNRSGQLGYGNTTTPYRTSVTKISSINGLVKEIYPSFHTNFYTLILGTNDRLSAVGVNTNGVLGIGNTTNTTSFRQVSGISGVKQAFNNSTCNYALGYNGLLSGWGTGGGLLGDLPLTTITPARLSVDPRGLGFDSDGNLLVALNTRIIKILPDNTISTFVTVGTDLKGLVIDKVNNSVYVVDNVSSNTSIKKITSSGSQSTYYNGTNIKTYSVSFITLLNNNSVDIQLLGVTSNFFAFFTADYGANQLAGASSPNSFSFLSPAGSNDGSALSNPPAGQTTAKVNFPKGLHYDNGFIYLADSSNSTIRKINMTTSPYSVTKLVTTTGLDPYDVVTDDNNVYFTDKNNNCIRSVSKNGGAVTLIAGSGTRTGSGFQDGIGTNALFKTPTYITIKDGFLYVSDSLNYAIRKINITTKEVTTIIGDGNYGTNTTPLTSYTYPNRLSAVEIPFIRNVNKTYTSKVSNTVYTLGTNKEVSAWGSNDFGQVGIDSTLTIIPTATRLSLSNINDIVITYDPTPTNTNPTTYERPTVYFIDENGGLSGCGFNGYGNLATGLTSQAVSAITKIDVPPIRKLYSDAQGFVYVIGTNNELSGWGRTLTYTFIPRNNNNISTLYRFSQLSGVNYLIVNDSNIDFSNGRMACAVGFNQRLTAWGGSGSLLKSVNPVEVSNITNVSSVFINFGLPNNIFINGAYYKTIYNRKYDNLEKLGGNDWKIVDKHGDFAIKLDNTLWSISSTPYQIGTDNNHDNVYYGTPVKNSSIYDIDITLLSSQNVDKSEYRITKNRSTGAILLSTVKIPSPNPFSTQPSGKCMNTTTWGDFIFNNDKSNITVKF